MQIHRIRGRTLDDALHRACSEHGEDAVVLSQEFSRQHGVTIAVAGGDQSRRLRAREAALALRRPVDAPRLAPRPDLADLEARLRRNGASVALTNRVRQAVEASGQRGAYTIDAAAGVLGRLFAPAPSPRTQGAPCVLAFVGPTGVGKTTSLAKLGIRLVRAGRRVAFATLDTYRVGAVDQLRTYAELLNAPIHVGRTGEDLAATLATADPAEVVLLDTTGRSPRDAASLDGLARDLARTGAGTTLAAYLVLAANSAQETLDAAIQAYGATSPAALVLTKLDETDRPAATLERTLLARRPYAFLCDGQDVTAHLHRAHPERFADLFLRGRLS